MGIPDWQIECWLERCPNPRWIARLTRQRFVAFYVPLHAYEFFPAGDQT